MSEAKHCYRRVLLNNMLSVNLIVLPNLRQNLHLKVRQLRLDNIISYNILAARGKEADFLYDTIDTYIRDAQNSNRSDLVYMWNTIKQDRQRHFL
jgi:hypothetical protein